MRSTAPNLSRCVSFLLVGDQPYAQHMVESANRVLGLPVIQMSDVYTAPVEGVAQVVRIRKDIPLMPYRLQHLASFKHDEMLILDADVLVKAPVDDVWARSFDVALCRRDEPSVMDGGVDIAPLMPVNTGVMFSRSQRFWQEAAIWLFSHTDYHEWYGDQMAVAKMCPRYHTLLLPAHEFNWTPLDAQDSSEARLWHYKGPRKAWMSNPPPVRPSTLFSLNPRN